MIALLLMLTLCQLPSHAFGAGYRQFMQISGLTGSSNDDRHRDWSDLISFSFVLGKKNCAKVIAIKALDTASPGLAALAVTETPVSDATIEVVAAGEVPFTVLTAELTRLVIANVEIDETAEDLVERVVIFPRQMRLTFRSQDPKGGLDEEVQTDLTCTQ